MDESKNLIASILKEIDRTEKVLELYKGIGPAGIFGAFMIEERVEAAKSAIASGDVISMLIIYKELKAIE